ncbi:MAG: AmmeMemoRadiSam system protein A, partial [Firmicutes bacterium]|nr:AmmeMemoRadiSam system protein A [Bacillota bacterium]
MKQTGVVLCALAPHPPLLIPEIGKRDIDIVKATQEAMGKIARFVSQAKPDVIIVISPHAPLFRDVIAVLADDRLSGDFSGFGVPHVGYSFKNDTELVSAIMDEATKIGVRTYKLDSKSKDRHRRLQGLDHGVLVPMHFISQEVGQDVPIVVMGTALLPRDVLYAFGQAIDKAARRLERRAVLIASGDLSHRLTREAPAGYSRRGREFDEKLIGFLRDMDVEGILSLDDSLLDEAGECGYRPVVTALGALSGDEVRSWVLSYEGPFGVGYGCVVFGPEIDSPGGCCSGECPSGESFPVKLARAAVEAYIKHGKRINPPEDVPQEFREQAGVFCTLKINGELRGCIGTIESTTGSIANEIIRNAIAAATADPRFHPVREDELDSLCYSVDVLMPGQRVLSLDELDPKIYGVIVRKGRKRGLLLPDIEGVDT